MDPQVLTISPGLRYEMALLPDYVSPTVPQNRFPLATHIPDDRKLVAPGIGVAWDIGNRGRTVMRTATGLFYAAPYMPVFEQAILTNGGNPELSSQIAGVSIARKFLGEHTSKKVTGLANLRHISRVRFPEHFSVFSDRRSHAVAQLDKGLFIGARACKLRNR